MQYGYKAYISLSQRQYDIIRHLSEDTRIPMSAYFREAIDMLIDKYKAKHREDQIDDIITRIKARK